MSTIKVVILDTQKIFVEGLKALFTSKSSAFEVVANYPGFQSFNQGYTGTSDIIIMDLNLEDGDGMQYIETIRSKYPNSKLVILTSYTESKYVKNAFQAGADGFISKLESFDSFLNGLEQVMLGLRFMTAGLRITPDASVFKLNFKSPIKKEGFEDKYQIRQKLTNRELEILKLIVEAKSNKEIGDELFISDQTVGVHRKNIMRKLNLKSTISLIKYALENQLV